MLAVGDSLVRDPGGHAQRVAMRLGAELEVRAQAGATTRQLMPIAAGAEAADVVLVGAGTNDILSGWAGPTSFRDDLSDLLDLLPVADLLVLTTFPIRLGSRPWPLPWSPGKPTRVRQAGAVVRELAAERGASVLDLDDLYRVGRVTEDRVHPARSGKDETARRLLRLLETRLGSPRQPARSGE